jgi:hypothetical protein
VKDIRKLLLLARRLRKRIGHLKPQADRCWRNSEVCRPSSHYTKIMISLSGFERATLMWANYTRLKLVQTEIRRRQQGQ